MKCSSIKHAPFLMSTHQGIEEVYYGRDARNRGHGWNQRGIGARYRGRRGNNNSPQRNDSSSQRRYNSSQRADKSDQQRRRKNPLDEHGEVSCCNVCGLMFRWASKCPDAYDYQEELPVVETVKNKTSQKEI